MYRISQPLAPTQFGDEKPKKKKRKVTKTGYVSGKSSGTKTVTNKKGNKTKTKEVYSEPGYSEIKKTKSKKNKTGYVSTKSSKKIVEREGPGKRAAKRITKGGTGTIDKKKKTIAITKDKLGNKTKTKTKGNKTKSVTKVKKEYASNAQPLVENPVVKRKGRKKYVKKTTYASNAQPLKENPVTKSKTRGRKPIR